MNERLWIGLDLGTTSTKACAFDENWQLVAMTSAAYPLLHPEPLAAVLDPQQVLQAAETALGELRHKATGVWAAIGISTAMHSLLLLDEQYQPISPIYTYADGRPVQQMGQINEAEARHLNQYTGTPVHPMSPLLQLLWLCQNHPQLFEQTAYFSDLKSYLCHRWTQNGLLLDYSLASATGLFELIANDWYQPALELAQVHPEQLPDLVPTTEVLHFRPELATNLRIEGVPLIIGGSDGCLANLGSDLLKAGEVAMTVGTSGAVRATHQGGLLDTKATLFNYHLYDNYLVCGGATNNGGKLLEWAFHTFAHGQTNVGQLIEAALAIPKPDLTFQPYLYGERAPIWDAAATASFSNLRGQHGPLEMTRAILEGLTDNLIVILQQLETAIGPVQKIHLSGGLARSKAWRKLVAEQSNCTVVLADTEQASAKGAAMIARLSLG
ncbi:MAG: gluconokinase [Bacteroidota bacterium]